MEIIIDTGSGYMEIIIDTCSGYHWNSHRYRIRILL